MALRVGRLRGAILVATFVLSGSASAGALSQEAPRVVPRPRLDSAGVLVAFRPGMAPGAREAAVAATAATAAERLSPLAPDVRVLRFPGSAAAAAAIAKLRSTPGVRYAEADAPIEAMGEPSDAYYVAGSLWGLGSGFGANAVGAWSAAPPGPYVGSGSVAVGVIDTGVMVNHPDLLPNRWVNALEASGTRNRDDDGNGYRDDVYGWDFRNGDATVFDGQADRHGTHVAGTIGAAASTAPDPASGVVGVNWNVRIVPVKFGFPGLTSDAIRALDYLTALRTRSTDPVNVVAVNASWGNTTFSQTLLDALNRAGDAGILVVASAGNDGSDNDAAPTYPASYRCVTPTRPWDCVVAVTAIDASGALATGVDPNGATYGMNSGRTSVDLGAPGAGIWSTFPVCSTTTSCTPGWEISPSGTSHAAPHVTGAIALCASIRAGNSPAQLRTAILRSTAPTASLDGRTLTGGRLDIGAMVALCESPPTSARLVADVAPDAAGERHGAVAFPSDSGIVACDAYPCERSTPVGGSVALTPVPDFGWRFAGWSGDCAGAATCVAELFVDRTVTAAFEPIPTWTLHVREAGWSESGVSRGTVSFAPQTLRLEPCAGDCDRTVLETTPVALTATAAAGSVFTGWSGACSAMTCTLDSPLPGTSERSVTATFVPSWTLSYTEVGQGTVAFSSPDPGAWVPAPCWASCQREVPQGETVDLTAAPDPGYAFSGWSGDCIAVDPPLPSNVCRVPMDAPRAVTATFAVTALPRTLTVSAAIASGLSAVVSSAPAGVSCGTGATACAVDFPAGTVVVLSISTTARRIAWSGCDATTKSPSTCTLTMTASRTVSVRVR